MPNFWAMVDQDDHIGGTGVGYYRIFICNLHYSLKTNYIVPISLKYPIHAKWPFFSNYTFSVKC